MATVIPFKGIRPPKNKAHLVASLSVTEYNPSEIKKELHNNPYSFLQIIHPEQGEDKRTKPDSIERLQKIKANYLTFINEGILVRDEQPCYYIYQQSKRETVYTGIIGCCSIDDYLNGTIKIHEQTITEREEKLKNYLTICDFNAEPVLFSYPDNKEINELTKQATQLEPEYDFTTTDGIRHKLWVVTNKTAVKKIRECFGTIPKIYIADGHHRSASSILYGKLKRKQHPDYTGKEPFNFYLGIFFPETQLTIFDYNRLVKDVNGLSVEGFIDKLSKEFVVTKKGTTVYKPTKKHNFSMYLQGEWYSLDAKQETVNAKNLASLLDSSILSEHILSPVLGINSLKTDKRIAFVSGNKGMEELKKQVDSGKFAIAFALYPVDIEQIKSIADSNNSMPPKTTWIEPKLRSGLVIYDLSE